TFRQGQSGVGGILVDRHRGQSQRCGRRCGYGRRLTTVKIRDAAPSASPSHGRRYFAASGLYEPAGERALMASRFQLLIAATASVRSVISASLNWARTRSYTSSGTWVSATRVTASVHSSAARSRSL